MRTRVYWLILLLVLVWSLVDEQIGVPLAGIGDPVTATDLLAWFLVGTSILIIEIRDAANHVVEKLRGRDE